MKIKIVKSSRKSVAEEVCPWMVQYPPENRR
jgi:hypothetical protein